MRELSRFIIVDDNEANTLFFQVLLGNLGKPDAMAATSIDQAMQLIEGNKIQFLITAWEMDPVPGTVLVQRIRGNRRTRDMPILIFSKRMSDEDIQLTKDLGFDNVLGMPFDRDSATQMVADMIKAEEEISPLELKVRKIEGFVADNDPKEALKMVNPSVTKKSPFRARVKTALGELWILVKQYKKSEVALTEALDDTEDYLPAKYMMAKLYSLTGRHEEAIALMEKASEQSPNNLRTLLNLGSAYVDAEEYDSAKEVFDRAESIDPGSKELKDEQGKLAFKQGDIPLAAQLLAETQSGDYLAREFNNVAIGKTASGDFSEAIKTYESAIKILADKTKVHLLTYNMALAFRKSGKLVSAFENMCESYIMNPEFEKAYAALVKTSKEIKGEGGKLDPELVKRVKEIRSAAKPKPAGEADQKAS